MQGIYGEENRLKKFLSEVDGRPYYNFHQQAQRDAPDSIGLCAEEKLPKSDDDESYPECKNIEQQIAIS